MNNFKIHLLFGLLECVMVVVSVEPRSQIKGKFYNMRWIFLHWEICKNNFLEANFV